MLTMNCPICNTYVPISLLFTIRKFKKKFKLRLVSDLSHRKSNYRFIWWFRVVSDLSPTLGKIGHQWFLKKNWYPCWQNQWFRPCKQWSHNSYKLFWRKNPQKILLSIFNFDLNVNKCPILPLFTVTKKFMELTQLFHSYSEINSSLLALLSQLSWDLK